MQMHNLAFRRNYPWYPSTWEGSKSLCDQIETLGTNMLPNVNDHATKLALFDKDFHVPWLPILTRKKRSIHFFPSLFSQSIIISESL